MPKSLDIALGIMMTLTGLLFLAYLPKASAHFAQEQQAGKLSLEEMRTKKKTLKLAGLCSLLVGVGLICIRVFDLYD
jgi:uncharacterized protein YjeT (DUF2065 family)